MQVNEIFTSVQGEGSFMGKPCTFIRLQGCNLACSFCDTKEAISFTKGNNLSIEQITAQIPQYINTVVITGGEPCMHTELAKLIEALFTYKVHLETNGTFAIPAYVDWVACSPKAEADFKIHEECRVDELKIVVTPDLTVPKIEQIISQVSYPVIVWLQPESSQMHEMQIKARQLADAFITHPTHDVRVGIQLHKILEVQ